MTLQSEGGEDREKVVVKRERFTMIRSFVLADILTLMNGACGSGSVLSAMQYLVSGESGWFVLSMALLPVALVFDFLDGRAARWRQKSSSIGADLDSLADVISFGMAPAAIGFAAGLRGGIDVLLLLFFVGCGISRLARFNATAVALADDSGKVSHFEGTPIPTSVGIVVVIWILYGLGYVGDNMWLGSTSVLGLAFHPVSLIYAVSGAAMVSTVRIPKF